MKRLMNIDELANYLRLRKQTIYNWLYQKKISGFKVGGVWRFDKREVDVWLGTRRLIIPKDTKMEKEVKGDSDVS